MLVANGGVSAGVCIRLESVSRKDGKVRMDTLEEGLSVGGFVGARDKATGARTIQELTTARLRFERIGCLVPR